ncbi:hypothetical protein KEM52_001075, partial [Ascosphaera acerosa]
AHELPVRTSTPATARLEYSSSETVTVKTEAAEAEEKVDADGDSSMGAATPTPALAPAHAPAQPSLKRSADEMEHDGQGGEGVDGGNRADDGKAAGEVHDTRQQQPTPAASTSQDVEMAEAEAEVDAGAVKQGVAESEEPAAKRAKVEASVSEELQSPTAPNAAAATPTGPAADSAAADLPTPSIPNQTLDQPAAAAPTSTITAAAAPATQLAGPDIKPEVKAQTSTPITKLQHKFLVRCLQGLKRTHDARFYKEPVDPVKMNIPSYLQIITHPMDISTIEHKLKAVHSPYATVDDVMADFDLMVNNAITFNGAEHPVAKEGVSLRASFYKNLAKMPGVDEVELAAPADKKKRGAKKGGSAASAATATTATAKSAGGNGSSKRDARSSGGRASIASQGTTFALSPEGLPLIRRDSTAADGRPKRSIHPPKNRDLPYSAKPKKKKYVWELKFCQEALDELFKPKYYPIAAPFYQPVDPVALNIPNYHSIIKKPMDLGTIGSKLKANLYEHAKEFEADVRLMFKNCYKFNIIGDPTYTAGQRLQEVFDKKWAGKERWLHAHEPPSMRAERDSAYDSDEEGGLGAGAGAGGGGVSDVEGEESEGEVADDEKLAALRRQMEYIAKEMDALAKKKSKTPPASSKKKGAGAGAAGSAGKGGRSSLGGGSGGSGGGSGSAKKGSGAAAKRKSTGGSAAAGGKGGKGGKAAAAARWVSYQEKQLISNVISTLPEKQMNDALAIIQRNAPSLIGSSADGEIELDIDELPNEVLLKLLNFVRKHAPQAVAELENPSSPDGQAAAGNRQHHSHVPLEPDSVLIPPGAARPRKNKPMNAHEQEAQINQLADRLELFKKGPGGAAAAAATPYAHQQLAGGNVGGPQQQQVESSDDEDSEESEEE